MAIALRSDRGIRVLAGASGVGFILAICGSNAMTPLLPGYMDTHGLGPAAASVLFATYFIALIIILLISARGPLIRHSRTVLPLALLAAIVGDLLQIVGASVEVLLFPGRFLTGASVGLSTGAAAAIMVAARGERGRAFIASGSLIGAGSGLVAAIAIAVFLPWQLVTVYAIHAGATAVCLIVLLVGLRLAPDLLAYRDDSPTDDGFAPQSTHAHNGDLDVHTGDLDVAGTRRRDPGAYLVGALAWAIGALAVGAMPAAILATGASDSLLVAQCVGGACLLVSMVASLAGVGVRLVTTLPAVGVLLVVGWSTAVVGLVLGRLDVIVLGTVVGGIGQAGGTEWRSPLSPAVSAPSSRVVWRRGSPPSPTAVRVWWWCSTVSPARQSGPSVAPSSPASSTPRSRPSPSDWSFDELLRAPIRKSAVPQV